MAIRTILAALAEFLLFREVSRCFAVAVFALSQAVQSGVIE